MAVAKNAPGVVEIFVGEDVATDNLGTPGMAIKRKRPDGSDMWAPPQTPLAQGRVRYVGDPIAMVVAASLDQAKDAGELIQADYDPLPSVNATHVALEPGAPAVLYWFGLTRKGGKAEYIPHQIDDNSGVGTQVAAGDVNGDGLIDIVVGNKKGAFVHLHSVKKVSKKQWQAAQPKRIN